MYDVIEVASGPITAAGDTVQLIQPTDSPSVIMIVWPVVVSKLGLVTAPVRSNSAEIAASRHRCRNWMTPAAL